MAIVIQRLTPATVDAAFAVFQTVLGEHPQVTKAAITERLVHGTGLFYGAVDTATGAMVGIKFGYIEGATCIGRGIAVLPAYRRQGVGTQLLWQFEQDLATRPTVTSYVFGSASETGIPFHLAQGYQPRVLLQLADAALRDTLDLAELHITQEGYNAAYQVYQIYADLPAPEQNLASLRRLQQHLPDVNVGFVFARALGERAD